MKNKLTKNTLRKPKYITPENYLQFKPSEFIRSFVSDIEVAEEITKKTGKHMNMDILSSRDNCLPCLGGMACLNMNLKLFETKLACTISMMGDCIRKGMLMVAQSYIRYLYPNYKMLYLTKDLKSLLYDGIDGIATQRQLKDLKMRIHAFADLIEKSGQ